jgi:hypothetical protein
LATGKKDDNGKERVCASSGIDTPHARMITGNEGKNGDIVRASSKAGVSE